MTDFTVPTFYLHSFTATLPDSAGPVTEFDNGAQIRLRWQSNGTSFTVYAAHDPQPAYSGSDQTCLVPGRTATTTFVLAAAVTGGPDGGTPEPGFETIYLYDALTVTIRNPDDTPKSVTVGTLTVTDSTQLRGQTTLGNATIGSLTVSGTTTLPEVTAGTLTVTGSTAMMKLQPTPPGVYQASTDGILVGVVGMPTDPSQCCAAWIGGWIKTSSVGGEYVATATGGNAVVYNVMLGDYTMWGNTNSFSVPVPRGTPFAATVSQMNGNSVPAPTSFWWVPLGPNSALRSIPEAEAAALGMPDPQPAPLLAQTYDPSAAIDEIVDIARQVAGGELPPGLAEQFSSALRSLAMHGA